MRTEYENVEALKSYIETNIANEYGALPIAEPLLGTVKVKIDSPDPDNMENKDMIYLEFDNGVTEEDSVMSDIAAMNVNVFILCSRDSQANLQLKCWGYYEAFYKIIKKDMSFNGAVDLAYISEWEWFPYVEAKPGCASIKATLAIQWQKTFA